MEKEKKSFNLITIIFLGIVIGLIIVGLIIYCLNAMKEDNKNNTTTNSANITENLVTTTEDTIIPEEEETIENSEFDYAKIYPDKGLVFSKEFVYYDGEMESYFRLELPVINLDFEEIKEINSKIEEFYNRNKIFYSNVESDSNDYNINLPELRYNYTLVDGILNIEIYCSESNIGFQPYYHIDIKDKKILSNEEFLHKLGIGEEKLEDLINDCILKNYFDYVKYDENLEKEYESIEDFRDTIKYTNIDNKGISQKYEYDFEKICNFCNIVYYSFPYSDDLIYIHGISIPLLGGTDSPSNETGIHINLDRKYVFYSIYRFNHISLPEESNINSINVVPYINLDSEDAIKVNAQLQKSFDDLIAVVEKNGGEIYSSPSELVAVQDGREIFADEVILNKDGERVIDKYYTMDFAYTIINDEILSVFVNKSVNPYEHTSAGNPEFLSYHFNIESGKLLSNEEFIEACGMRVEDFKENLNTKLDLVFNGDSSNIDYDINNLKITFYDYNKLFSDSKYDGYIENELEMFYVIGENFPNYPYTWITVDLENNQ